MEYQSKGDPFMTQISLDSIGQYKGKRVSTTQLENIYDLYIILTDVTLEKNKLGIGSFVGTLDCFSTKPLKITKPNSTIVYHDSYEREENCEYE